MDDGLGVTAAALVGFDTSGLGHTRMEDSDEISICYAAPAQEVRHRAQQAEKSIYYKGDPRATQPTRVTAREALLPSNSGQVYTKRAEALHLQSRSQRLGGVFAASLREGSWLRVARRRLGARG